MSAEALEETLRRWAAEAADPDTEHYRRQQIMDWSVGASIALAHLGYDELAKIADEIWRNQK